jgi:glycosyltransferase involved in cell wall biosynthesis
MRLLILTQVVDPGHSNLGFFDAWIREFSKHCESVEVICLQEGAHNLPENVLVHSLGKEVRVSRIVYLIRFYRYIWTLRRGYDAVFVHMNPEYVVLGGLFWRAWGKKVGLWYVHKSVTLRLRLAVMIANTVFTVAPESFRLKTRKLAVVGHGIDTNLFRPQIRTASSVLRIVTVGRVSSSKGIDKMLEALDVLCARGIRLTFSIVGAPITAADQPYEAQLKQTIASKPYASSVAMRGALPNRELPEVLRESDVFVNISATGGYDKAVLEALACGVPAISSSDSFRPFLDPYGLFIRDTGPEMLARAIEAAARTDVAPLQREIEEHHSLSRLIPAILRIYGA